MAEFKSPTYGNRVIGGGSNGISISAILTKNDLVKLVSIQKKTGIRRTLGTVADVYLDFVHSRHKANSSGGKWAALSKRTKRGREDKYNRRHTPHTAGVNAILIDTGQLLGATAPNGRGQVRRLDVNTLSIKAGISGTTVYYDPRKNAPGTRPGSRRSLGQLAKWAADGQPGGPTKQRRIIVAPDTTTKREMKREIREWMETFN